MADGALAASTTQSAAESEEDLLRFHARANASPSVGAFSTSSVDQFLRDNGFQLDDDDDDVLSSSAASTALAAGEAQRTVTLRTVAQAPIPGSALGDDAAAAVEGLLRGDALTLTRRDRDDDNDGDGDVLSSDEGSHLSSAHVGSTAAGEEGDMPPPRFILLDDEELLSMSHEPPSSVGTPSSTAHVRASDWRRAVPSAAAAGSHREARMGGSFDRSMLLGGSGLSALSEESHDSTSAQAHAVAEPARGYRRLPPRSMHHQDAQAVKTGPRASLVDRLVASSSSSSSASYASSPRALSSSSSSRASGQHDQASKRSHDDELSDALGVGSSIAQHDRHQTAVDSRQRLEPRRLSPHEDEEHKEATEQRGDPAAANPWTRSERPNTRGDEGGDEREAQKAQWADLNILLRKNGLPTLALRDVTRGGVVPDHGSMINLVQEFLLQLGQKNEAIQDLVIDSNRTYKVQNKAEGDAVLLGKKNEELQRSLQSAQNEMKRLQGEVQRQKDETETQTKNLKASCLKLQQQLKVSEHRVKAKEVLVERMQKKIQQQVDKENMNKTRDRKIFKQLQQRDPRKANAKDNQSLECISIYETQREQMQEEIEHLRGQVASLNGELRDKENVLSRHSSFSQASAHWSDSGVSDSHHSKFDAADDMLMRLEAARRVQEQAAAKLRQRETIMVKKISAIEEELLAARETIAELKDENANLTLEAESRPSIRDYRLSQRRIHQLERQLSEQKLALEEANDINELRRFMGTTELIERDRLNHRLHLNRLGTLPKETLLEVVKEVCRVLNLTDITLITPSLHKLCNVVTAVPRMEKFIRDVCGFVYFNFAEQDNQQEDARFELEQVIPTLQQWMVERKKLFELQGFKTAVITELCKRSVEPSLLKQQPSAESESHTQLSSLPRAVHMVAELVELEKSVMHHREIYTQAAEELERRPSVLVNQIVRHFSHVFNVKQVEGVLPRINEIFLFVNEMENFLKAIRSLLVLKPNASPVVCIDAIRSLVEGESGNARTQNTDKPEDAPNYVVQKSTRGPVDVASGGVAGVREVREMSVLVRDLKKELGAATMQEILPRTRRLMELLSLSIHQNQDNEDDF